VGQLEGVQHSLPINPLKGSLLKVNSNNDPAHPKHQNVQRSIDSVNVVILVCLEEQELAPISDKKIPKEFGQKQKEKQMSERKKRDWKRDERED